MNVCEVWEDVLDFEWDENGRIVSPGKFEGEMLYVPALWAKSVIDGGVGGRVVRVSVSAIDKATMKSFFGSVRGNYSKLQGFLVAVASLQKKRSVSLVERDGLVSQF